MPHPSPLRLVAISAAVFAFAFAANFGAKAQENEAATNSAADGKPTLDIELNRMVKTDNGCRVGFVTKNDMGSALSKASFEVVLFNRKGLIEKLLVLDFGAMAKGRTKVREFNLAGIDCGSVSRVLVNDVSACEGDSVTADQCMAALSPSSRTGVEFGL